MTTDIISIFPLLTFHQPGASSPKHGVYTILHRIWIMMCCSW